MHFLKTLFWLLVAVVVALFAARNWSDVTLHLWGNIEADVKIPLLLLVFFLLGFVPTWLIMRTRLWSNRRRLEALERRSSPATATEPAAEEPVL